MMIKPRHNQTCNPVPSDALSGRCVPSDALSGRCVPSDALSGRCVPCYTCFLNQSLCT
jgi:hypothetical protein